MATHSSFIHINGISQERNASSKLESAVEGRDIREDKGGLDVLHLGLAFDGIRNVFGLLQERSVSDIGLGQLVHERHLCLRQRTGALDNAVAKGQGLAVGTAKPTPTCIGPWIVQTLPAELPSDAMGSARLLLKEVACVSLGPLSMPT